MSTIKISQLPALPSISTNTSNSLFIGVDIPSGVTGKFTATTLAQQLYSNNALVVGTNPLLFSNTIAQFSGSDPNFLQTNLQNFNSTGSADYIITADTGTNSTNYVDLGINNSQFNNVGYTSMYPLDAYLYVQDATGNGNGGNLVIGTASSNTRINFIVAGTNVSNIVAYVDSYGIHSPSIDAEIAANIAIQNGINTTQNTNIQSAWNTANTSLQNTSTITVNNSLNIPGNLTVTGNVYANVSTSFLNNSYFNGYVNIRNSSYNSSNALVTISGGPNGLTNPPANTDYILQISGKDYYPTRFIIDSYGAGNTYSLIAGRSARGNTAYPTATQAGDILMRYAGNGYGASGFNGTGVARMDIVATENFTDTSHGAQIQFWCTSNGTNTLSQIATLNGNNATFTGTVSPNKGFIYTPTVYPGAQTAITVDFSNNSLLRAQTSSGLTVSFQNYVVGKVVEMWITNTAGTNQTFTHGCSSTNSTVNSTTYTIPGTSTIYARYFCIDGTLANTFVSIVHS